MAVGSSIKSVFAARSILEVTQLRQCKSLGLARLKDRSKFTPSSHCNPGPRRAPSHVSKIRISSKQTLEATVAAASILARVNDET